MYQEVEIPKRGKHSMSQDLPVLSFLFLVFHFVLFVCLFVWFLSSRGLVFSAFSVIASNGTEYIFSGYMCSLRIMSIKQTN